MFSKLENRTSGNIHSPIYHETSFIFSYDLFLLCNKYFSIYEVLKILSIPHCLVVYSYSFLVPEKVYLIYSMYIFQCFLFNIISQFRTFAACTRAVFASFSFSLCAVLYEAIYFFFFLNKIHAGNNFCTRASVTNKYEYIHRAVTCYFIV